jgi:putative transposase
MRQPSALYKRHRFPGEIISHAVWLSSRFLMSYRDVEELLAERGITVSYETVRRWCRKFGARYAAGVRRRRPRPGDNWHLDELALKINGTRPYLWRAVDQGASCSTSSSRSDGTRRRRRPSFAACSPGRDTRRAW